MLFLLAMGLGLGTFVDAEQSARRLGGVSYLVFLAPGLLAAQAMQTAVGESTYPLMAGIMWLRTFHAMVATPVRPLDVVVGQMLWFAFRLTLVATAFVIVMILFGAADVVGRPGDDPGGGAHRARVRGAGRGLDRDPADRLVVPGHQPVHRHPAVHLQRHLLPDLPAAPISSSGSPT